MKSRGIVYEPHFRTEEARESEVLYWLRTAGMRAAIAASFPVAG